MIEIKNCSGEVIFACEAESMRAAVEKAITVGTSLRDADLAGADLGEADLRCANLNEANLEGVDLSGANLRGADLSGAFLDGADLRFANLRSANLRDARLHGVKIRGAELAGVTGLDFVPVVDGLDRQILNIVSSGDGQLAMSEWHLCETTHCRAGWAIHLAGAAGYALEKKFGVELAGALIYAVSTGGVPDFFAADADDE
jgi:uncharacterized protein YjbI with pentapeptide repeats